MEERGLERNSNLNRCTRDPPRVFAQARLQRGRTSWAYLKYPPSPCKGWNCLRFLVHFLTRSRTAIVSWLVYGVLQASTSFRSRLPSLDGGLDVMVGSRCL